MTNISRTFTLGVNYGPRKKAMYWWKDPSQWYRDAGRNFDRLFQERRGAIPDSGCTGDSDTVGEVTNRWNSDWTGTATSHESGC